MNIKELIKNLLILIFLQLENLSEEDGLITIIGKEFHKLYQMPYL